MLPSGNGWSPEPAVSVDDRKPLDDVNGPRHIYGEATGTAPRFVGEIPYSGEPSPSPNSILRLLDGICLK